LAEKAVTRNYTFNKTYSSGTDGCGIKLYGFTPCPKYFAEDIIFWKILVYVDRKVCKKR
jgi:hypothetical protein